MDYKEKVIALLNSQELSKEQKEKLEKIFPELKESEDEKVSKEILAFINLKKSLGGMNQEQLEKSNSWIAWLEKQGEQKSDWSEEDKDFMYNTLSNLTELKDRYGEGYGNVGKCIDWLKSLKDRVQPQPKQEWSEEDERILSLLLNNYKQAVEHRPSSLTHTEVLDIYNFLKSLKERYVWKPNNEQMEALYGKDA